MQWEFCVVDHTTYISWVKLGWFLFCSSSRRGLGMLWQLQVANSRMSWNTTYDVGLEHEVLHRTAVVDDDGVDG